MPTEIDTDVQIVGLDLRAPSIELAVITGPLTRVKRWDGTAWVEVNPGNIYIVRSGDPTPPLLANDVVLAEH
jgi:hypothetical protein